MDGGRKHAVHWNGSYWADVSSDSCTSVWGTSSSDLWLSCYGGVEHYDGTVFETVADFDKASIGGTASGATVAVSEDQEIYRYVNGQWGRVAPTQGTSHNDRLDSIQIFPGGDAIAHYQYYKETLVRRSGIWANEPNDLDYNNCLWGTSVDDYWIGGEATSNDPLAPANRYLGHALSRALRDLGNRLGQPTCCVRDSPRFCSRWTSTAINSWRSARTDTSCAESNDGRLANRAQPLAVEDQRSPFQHPSWDEAVGDAYSGRSWERTASLTESSVLNSFDGRWNQSQASAWKSPEENAYPRRRGS